ncbi:MAG TPA: DUF4249 domain-containing protein [Daejeonella sp.]|nr:DUF4249 domain-containing protein [Daejeonella sp.]
MKFFRLFVLSLFIFSACKEPYDPAIGDMKSNFLVVEGLINSGPGTTSFTLSRTVGLASKINSAPELRAKVSIEAQNGSSIVLTERGKGVYSASHSALNIQQKYRLKILTSEGKEYLSDYVNVQLAPEMDKVEWDKVNQGVELYVSTHDATNNTRYYRWEYEETWQFNPPYYINLEYKNGAVIDADPSINMYNCWKTEKSTKLLLGSSARLEQDVIHKSPLLFIEPNSEKLGIKYSILVKQHALSKEAFNYWNSMQKISEQMGTIYDPQPSQIRGNIRCVIDPSEPVVGFVSASSVKEKRIFISQREQLPEWRTPLNRCEELEVFLKDLQFYFSNNTFLPLTPFYDPTGERIIGYIGVPMICGDCRLRGTNVKPSFWE